MTAADLRQQIKAALANEGAFCGQCGWQPGESGCADCERCWDRYADALLPIFETEHTSTLTKNADLPETLGMDDASAQLRYQATPYTDDTAYASTRGEPGDGA